MVRSYKLSASHNGETIHPPVDNSLKNRLTVAFFGLYRSVTDTEKPNSDLYSQWQASKAMFLSSIRLF